MLPASLLLALALPANRTIAPGAYPRVTPLANGTLVLVSEVGVSGGKKRLALHSTNDASQAWVDVGGPVFDTPPGTDLANGFVLEDGGELVVAFRHHDMKSTPPVYRIQVVRSTHGVWSEPSTAYATTDPLWAAWEPVLWHSENGRAIRVTYSMEHPPDPACESGVNYPGGDIGNLTTRNGPCQCRAACAGTAACAKWSFRESDSTCFLKTGAAGTAKEPGLTSGSPSCYISTCPRDPCEAGVNYPGSDVLAKPVRAESSCACAGVCASNQECVSWSFRESDAMCWLKRAGHGRVAAAGMSSGSKRCSCQGNQVAAGLTARGKGTGDKEQDIVTQQSDDGGLTWGPVYTVSRTPGSRNGMPSIARQPDGCHVCVFEGFWGTDWGHFDVGSVRTCDDGATWGADQAVFPAASKLFAHAPTVAVLGDGRAAVSSMVNSESGVDGAETQVQFSGKLSRATPTNFSFPVTVQASPLLWPQVFVDAAGALWAVAEVAGKVNLAGPIDV